MEYLQVNLCRYDEDVIPKFVIEILSGIENINRGEEKIIEYYKAGVKIVWLIYPSLQMFQVYSSRKEVKICSDSDLCSANSVLKGFEITVNELFE